MITYRQPFQGDYPITQRFGETVTDPNGHTGIDYACPVNTPILASADGIVMKAGWDSTGYGNCIIILHAKDRATLYAHLDECNVYDNQKVRQSDVIGWSGYTGNVVPAGIMGAHLHFEARTRWNDIKTAFDPMTLPLMSFADPTEKAPENPQRLPAGVCRIACDYAFIRTWDGLIRERTLTKGERVYIFDDVKIGDHDLPFRFIGAGRCIAEYDIDGTQILEPAE